MKFIYKLNLFILLTLLLLITDKNIAQTESFMQPFVKDSNTVLLLHFDDNLENASDSSEDAIANGNVNFFPNSELTSFGSMAYLDNDAVNDSSYLTIPHSDALTLQEDWTMEGWVQFLTFGESEADWHWRPMLIVKPWNYMLEMISLGGAQFFSPSYRAVDDELIRIEGNRNTVKVGTLYHWTYIRDAKNKMIILLVNDKDNNLVDFKIEPFSEDVPPPRPNTEPVLIGNWPFGIAGGYLNGLIDEVRISNVVRNYEMPPIIAEVKWKDILHPAPNQPIIVKANIVNYGGEITLAKLFYSTGGDFTSVDMTKNGDLYEGIIPAQSLGSEVKYYIDVENSAGYSATSKNSAVDTNSYYGISVWEENTNVLHLNFEDINVQAPYDSSQYHQKITVNGKPEYSLDAKSGNYSMYFEGDTSYLQIDQPASFMISNDFTADFWFKTLDTLFGRTLFMKHPEYHWDDWQFGYRMWFRAGGDDIFLAPEVYIETPGETDQRWKMVDVPVPIKKNKWYHVIMKVSEVNKIVTCSLSDSNDTVLHEGSISINGFPKPRAGKFSIAGDYDNRPKFNGFIDNFKFYNYALNLPPSITAFHEHEVSNQEPNKVVDITCEVINASEVYINYYQVGGDTSKVLMAKGDGNTYTGKVPGQPHKTSLEYFITALNAENKQVRTPETGQNYAIGFANKEIQTLNINFEEGSDAPADKSEFAHNIIVHGEPKYSTDAKEGTYSMEFDGKSSYLEIPAPSPFLASKEITIDFWFKADSALPGEGTDLLGKFPSRGESWAFGSRVWFRPEGELLPEAYIVSDYGQPDQRWTSFGLGKKIEVGKWYRVLYEIGKDSGFTQVFNENNELFAEGSAKINGYLRPVSGKFTIGHSQFDNMPYFKGKIDGIKIYNYAKDILVGIDDNNNKAIPTHFALHQNYPNPFNPSTEISFALPQTADIKLTVYNILGQKVVTLLNSEMKAGNHTVKWNSKNEFGSSVASGIYIYKLEAGKFNSVKKMVLLR